MTTTALSPVPRLQFLDAIGVPLAGGKVYTYAAGTTTPQASYTDSSGTVLNSNPVILDAGGFGEIWLDTTLGYKLQITDSFGSQQYVVDNIFTQPQGVAFLGNAQTFTALQTLTDLIVKGPIPAGWPAAAQGQLLIAGNDPTRSLGFNIVGRIYCGDGTGYYLGISTRVGNVDKDIVSVLDQGILIVAGGLTPQINIGTSGSSGTSGTDVKMIVNPGAARLVLKAADNTGPADLEAGNFIIDKKITQYNNVGTAANGIGVIVSSLDLTNQTTAIGSSVLFGPNTPAGMYELHYYLYVSNVDGSAINLVGQFTWTDNVSGHTVSTANIDCSGFNDSTTAVGLGKISFYQTGQAGNSINYATTLSGALTAGKYDLHVRLVYLG